VRIIRTMCSARVSPRWIERAFLKGAGAVLVSGCHPADCHYNNANQHTARRVEKFWRRMEKIGINKDRLRLAWVSAAEGAQFAKVVQEMAEGLKKLTPAQIQDSIEKLTKSLNKKAEAS
jgi:heterodisulfide reductase subunit A2